MRAGVEYGGGGDARQKEVVARLDEVRAELASLRDDDQHQERASSLLGQYAELATSTLSREWLDPNPAFDKWGQAFDHLKAGRFRLAGHGSTAGLMAYGDANAVAMEIGEFEVLPVVEEVPVICGVQPKV
jgi:hypothetical protein